MFFRWCAVVLVNASPRMWSIKRPKSYVTDRTNREKEILLIIFQLITKRPFVTLLSKMVFWVTWPVNENLKTRTDRIQRISKCLTCKILFNQPLKSVCWLWRISFKEMQMNQQEKNLMMLIWKHQKFMSRYASWTLHLLPILEGYAMQGSKLLSKYSLIKCGESSWWKIYTWEYDGEKTFHVEYLRCLLALPVKTAL